VTDNISSNTLSVTTYPSHFKLSASHHNNLQRERELVFPHENDSPLPEIEQVEPVSLFLNKVERL